MHAALETQGEPLRLQRLLGRAGFGARPGDLAEISALGADAWIERETHPSDDPALEARLAHFTGLDSAPGSSMGDLLGEMTTPEARSARDRGARPKLSKETKRALRRESRAAMKELIGARLVRAVHGRWGLREVMIDFWSNHFSISGRRPLVAGLLPQHEREVLEPHALGRFEDLLVSTATSPAMLVYLDNWRSSVERSRRRRRRAPAPSDSADRAPSKRGGINENYARELLELHTLGIEGGYGQRDVVEVARVFTGWTLADRHDPRFRFRTKLHDTGTKTVLGERITGAGVDEGLALLRRLARHPATARHVSHKLCARFVADDPPPALVDRSTERFLHSDGDIASVVALILRSPELADPRHRKLKTPLRFVASAIRAGGGETDGGRPLIGALEALGELPFMARTPAGYPDRIEAWVDPGAMLERMAIAFALAEGRVRGTSLGHSLHGRASLGHASPGATSTEARPAAAQLGEAQARALSIASPEFQWA
jgi:uncharacterized protein (DUF1800 family)